MKKLLGILVLGLLWCNTSFAESSLPKCQGDPKQWTNCQGKMSDNSGYKYDGEFINGNIGGKGILFHPNGDKWVGEFITTESGWTFNGKGTITTSDGGKYEGEFKDSIMSGKGTFLHADGGKYVGEFKDGVMSGKGTFFGSGQFAGHTYVGEWKDGKQNGQGTYTYQNGDKYVGEWKNSNSHGQGTFTWANGESYVGEFVDHKFNGKGTYTYNSGGKYVGEWKDDLREGRGTYTYSNGKIVEGIYKSHQLVEVLKTTEDKLDDNDTFGIIKAQEDKLAEQKAEEERRKIIENNKLVEAKKERWKELYKLSETAKPDTMIFTKVLKENTTDKNNYLCWIKQKDYFLDAATLSNWKAPLKDYGSREYSSVEDLLGAAAESGECGWLLANLNETILLRGMLEEALIKYDHKLDKRFFEFDDPKQFVFDHFSSLKIETDSEYKLLEHIDFDEKFYLTLKEQKILSINELEKLKNEAKAIKLDCMIRTEEFIYGLCGERSAESSFLFSIFLELRQVSIEQGVPIAKIIEIKLREGKKYEEKLKKEKKIQEAARKKEREEYAKKYPFYAEITCSAGGNIQYLSYCLTDDYGGGGSSIRLRTSDSLLETSFMDILQNNPSFGRLDNSGALFIIDLPYKYKLLAQMGGREYGSLTIKIFERVTKSLIYTSNASTRFSIATASN